MNKWMNVTGWLAPTIATKKNATNTNQIVHKYADLAEAKLRCTILHSKKVVPQKCAR